MSNVSINFDEIICRDYDEKFGVYVILLDGQRVYTARNALDAQIKRSNGYMVMDCCSGHIARFHFNHFGFYTGGNTMCCLEHRTKCSKNKPVCHTNDVSVIMIGRFL